MTGWDWDDIPKGKEALSRQYTFAPRPCAYSKRGIPAVRANGAHQFV